MFLDNIGNTMWILKINLTDSQGILHSLTFKPCTCLEISAVRSATENKPSLFQRLKYPQISFL